MAKIVSISEDRAVTLALRYVAYMASDADRLGAFAAATGHDLASVKVHLSDKSFLGQILDHVLHDESDLIAFAASNELDPMDVARARRALPGADGDF